jgi:hypothetical protein
VAEVLRGALGEERGIAAEVPAKAAFTALDTRPQPQLRHDTGANALGTPHASLLYDEDSEDSITHVTPALPP